MSETPWKKYITEDNLPNEDMKILSSVIGIEMTAKVICELKGIVLSVPVNGDFKAKLAYITNAYDGTKKSRIYLAKTCGISEGYIYKLIRNNLKENK